MLQGSFSVREQPAMRAPQIVVPDRFAGDAYHFRDHANDPGLTLRNLEVFLEDLQNEPPWRTEADIDADYYDGKQLPTEVLATLRSKGMGPLTTELVKPTINAVLGLEAQTRTDWNVAADDERFSDVADALSARLKEAERETRADRSCADAYAGEIKVGLHWVEVSRSSNPFEYPYRVKQVHRREIYWDHRAREPDLSDCRFLIRKRWLDEDQAKAFFPYHAELIGHACRGFRDWVGDFVREDLSEHLQRGFRDEQNFNFEEAEWRDTERGRILALEVWYRVWTRGTVLIIPSQNNRAVEYDPTNPRHKIAIAAGMAEPIEAVYPKMRLSWWLGPHRITDSPIKDNEFPYVPFWGYREDKTLAPYGMIRAMRSPQDEVNARFQKMYWLLSARRIIADADAIDLKANDWNKVKHEAGRADGVIVLNQLRRNLQTGFQIVENIQLANEQAKLIEERKRAVQETAGVFMAQLGQAGAADSGIAIDKLVQQGVTSLAELNDNYRFGRRKVGELLVNLIRQDLAGRQMTFEVDKDLLGKKKVTINLPSKDAFGNDMLENDVEKSRVKVALGDVPQSNSFREQQFTMLGEAIKSMPPQAQAIMTPVWIEFSNLPQRKILAKQLREAFGINTGEEPTPEQAQALEQAQQQEEAMRQLQMTKLAGDIEEQKLRIATAQQQARALESQMTGANGAPDPAIMDEMQSTVADYEKQITKLTQEIAALRTESTIKMRELLVREKESEDKKESEIARAEIERDTEEAVAKIEAQRDQATQAVNKALAALGERVDQLTNKFAEPKKPKQITIKRKDGSVLHAKVDGDKIEVSEGGKPGKEEQQ